MSHAEGNMGTLAWDPFASLNGLSKSGTSMNVSTARMNQRLGHCSGCHTSYVPKTQVGYRGMECMECSMRDSELESERRGEDRLS